MLPDRHKLLLSQIVASSVALLFMQKTSLAGSGPAYNIYPLASVGSNTVVYGQGISQNGTYAAGMTQRSNGSNGILYNVSAGTSTLESQTGVTYGATRPPTQETYGVPYSVNNQGVMFGSSGIGVNALGEATVWQNGQAYGLNAPGGAGFAGQLYGSNNLNTNAAFGGTAATEAVGSVGSASGGLNQAAIFFYYGAQSSSNYSADLNEPTSNGGRLTSAFAINDSGVVVGTADDPNNAALTVPFLLNLGAGATSAIVIPNAAGGTFQTGIPFAISNTGLVTGGGDSAFIYNMSSGTTINLPLAPGTSQEEGRGINDSGEVVGYGGGQYAVPFLYDGTATYDLQNLLANNSAGAWHLDDNTSSGASSIADNGDIVGRGYYNGNVTGFIMVPAVGTVNLPQKLTFNNTGGSGDGVTWDTTQQNWNNGSGVTTFSSTNADTVTLDDNNNGHYNVSIPAVVTPGSTTINNSAGDYVFSGAGGIGGFGRFTKSGTGTVTLNTVNTWADATSINGGTLVLGVAGALPAGTNLSLSGNDVSNTISYLIAKSVGTAYALQVGSVSLFQSIIDLQNNDLIVHSGTLAAINTLVTKGYDKGAWDGFVSYNSSTGVTVYDGILSSMAGPSHPLNALGVIVNDNGSGVPLYGSGGTIASTFGGATPVDGDILVKFTYVGDANLDGKVDGTDYGLIDNAYSYNQAHLTAPLTGWLNGDFNYDGVVDGSDYTLIDNAFNQQGTAIATQVASSTSEIAGANTAVPEPATVGLLCMSAIGILSRRRRA